MKKDSRVITACKYQVSTISVAVYYKHVPEASLRAQDVNSFKLTSIRLYVYVTSTFILFRETSIITRHREVVFPSDNDEYRGYQVLFDKGSPISYLGDRRYVVSEEDCKVFHDKGIKYTVHVV